MDESTSSSMLPRGASMEDFFFTGYRLLSGGDDKEYVDQNPVEDDHGDDHGSFGVHIEYEGALRCVALK